MGGMDYDASASADVQGRTLDSTCAPAMSAGSQNPDAVYNDDQYGSVTNQRQRCSSLRTHCRSGYASCGWRSEADGGPLMAGAGLVGRRVLQYRCCRVGAGCWFVPPGVAHVPTGKLPQYARSLRQRRRPDANAHQRRDGAGRGHGE